MNDDRTVWYRKWRPQTFAEVVGQEHVTRTLRNAVAAGRTAHAYMLCGPRGTGKTTTARLLAKAVNCTSPLDGEPCDRCQSCVAVREGRALDLIEMDAASNRGIDDIRDLRERVGYAASGGRYKVYLIDEVHELTQQAFDALLKTLEEPPPHVIFVLATTDAHRVPATILSRCQRFDLARARLGDVVARLRAIASAEGVEADDETLAVIGRAATGSFRDAVNLLEQLVASHGRALDPVRAREGLGLTGDARAVDLAALALAGDLPRGLVLIGAVRDDGVDLRQFCREVTEQLRATLLLRAGAGDGLDLDGPARERLAALAETADAATITRALRAFGGADFRADPQASLPLELAFLEVALGGLASAPTAPPADETRPLRAEGTAVARPPATPAPAAQPAVDPPPAEPDAGPTAELIKRLAKRANGDAPPAAPPPEELPAAPQVVPPAAEAAAPAAEPGASDAGAGPITLAAARDRYREIYERLQEANRLFAARLNPGDIIAVDDEAITFGLPHALQLRHLADGTPAYRGLVSVVAQVFGRPYAVHCVHMPDVEDRLRAQPARASHLLDEALKLGARPLTGS